MTGSFVFTILIAIGAYFLVRKHIIKAWKESDEKIAAIAAAAKHEKELHDMNTIVNEVDKTKKEHVIVESIDVQKYLEQKAEVEEVKDLMKGN